jgi:hypothetical protein
MSSIGGESCCRRDLRSLQVGNKKRIDAGERYERLADIGFTRTGQGMAEGDQTGECGTAIY